MILKVPEVGATNGRGNRAEFRERAGGWGEDPSCWGLRTWIQVDGIFRYIGLQRALTSTIDVWKPHSHDYLTVQDLSETNEKAQQFAAVIFALFLPRSSVGILLSFFKVFFFFFNHPTVIDGAIFRRSDPPSSPRSHRDQRSLRLWPQALRGVCSDITVCRSVFRTRGTKQPQQTTITHPQQMRVMRFFSQFCQKS